MSEIYVRVDTAKDIVEYSTTWEIQEALTESTEYTATVSSVATAVQVDGPRSTGTWRKASDGTSGTAPATAGNPLYETDGVQVSGDSLSQVLADIALALNAWYGDATNGASSTVRALKLVASVRGNEIVFTTSDGSKITNMTEVTESGAFSVSAPVEADLGHTDTVFTFNPRSVTLNTQSGVMSAVDSNGTAVAFASGSKMTVGGSVSNSKSAFHPITYDKP